VRPDAPTRLESEFDGTRRKHGGLLKGHIMTLRKILFLAAALAASLPAFAEEDHRELGPHEHGVGRLNIAIEDKRVSMELEVPGADIVGFEHEASTKEQKAAVNEAKTTLEAALGVFKLPAGAKCKVTQAKVSVEAEDAGKHEQELDPDAADEAGHDSKAAGEEHRHSQFHATYALDCAAPEKLTGIDFKYFELFPGARKLDINLVTANGQNHYEVTRENPQLDFGDIG
jgi:hypothetical protein